jgi:hypothetical protein
MVFRNKILFLLLFILILFFFYKFFNLNINKEKENNIIKESIIKPKKEIILFNIGKKFWNIYYKGTQITKLDTDYATAIPSKIRASTNKKIIKGPYNCSIKNINFSYLVVFSINKRYITRATVIIKHLNILRRNKVNLTCKVKKIYKEDVTCIHLNLEFYSPKLGERYWSNDIYIYGNGECETINFYETVK